MEWKRPLEIDFDEPTPVLLTIEKKVKNTEDKWERCVVRALYCPEHEQPFVVPSMNFLHVNPIAWMKFPEPFSGEREDQTKLR